MTAEDTHWVSVRASEEPLQTSPLSGHRQTIHCKLCDSIATYRIEEEEGEVIKTRYYCKPCFERMALAD